MTSYKFSNTFVMNRIVNVYLGLILSAAVTIGFSSCIKEYPDICRVHVSFDYSYNMLSANAFENQVDELMLYVFDENGILLSKHSRQGRAISNAMIIEIDKSQTGHYQFVAWGRSNTLANENANFEIPDLIVGESLIQDLKYYLTRNSGSRDGELNHFLVGVQGADIKQTPDIQAVKVPLKKVTKKIRIVILPYSATSELDVNSYSFRVEDPVGNGLISYDFSLLEDTPITYLPYYKANIVPSAEDNPTGEEVNRAIAAEIATSRLWVPNNPRLYISNSDEGREIVNISLPFLFSLTQLESHQNWSLQEYLDRQDEFVITLFFDSGKWINSTIIINGWVINNVIFN